LGAALRSRRRTSRRARSPHHTRRNSRRAPHRIQHRSADRGGWRTRRTGSGLCPSLPCCLSPAEPSRPGLSSTGRRFVND
jgi:hypothetical protein